MPQVMKAFVRASTSNSRCEFLVQQGTHLGPSVGQKPCDKRHCSSTFTAGHSNHRTQPHSRHTATCSTALRCKSGSQQASMISAVQNADGKQQHIRGIGSCLATLYLLGATGSIGRLALKPSSLAHTLLTQDNAIRPDCAQTLCTKAKPPFMSFSATTASFSGARRCATPLLCAPAHPAACCSHRNAESQQAKERQQECSPFVSCGDVQLKVNLLHIHMHRDEVSCSSWAMAMQG